LGGKRIREVPAFCKTLVKTLAAKKPKRKILRVSGLLRHPLQFSSNNSTKRNRDQRYVSFKPLKPHGFLIDFGPRKFNVTAKSLRKVYRKGQGFVWRQQRVTRLKTFEGQAGSGSRVNEKEAC
jgi:hypothetical protein